MDLNLVDLGADMIIQVARQGPSLVNALAGGLEICFGSKLWTSCASPTICQLVSGCLDGVGIAKSPRRC